MPSDVTVSVRITKRSHLQLRLLSATTGRPIHDLVTEAVADHYRTDLDRLRGATPLEAPGQPKRARHR